MAKRKNMTAEEVGNLVSAAADAARDAADIQDACSKMAIDAVDDPLGLAHSLICATRDLNQTALSLMGLHDLQEQRKKIRQYEAEEKAAEAKAANEARAKREAEQAAERKAEAGKE